jgi:hypothetical protein
MTDVTPSCQRLAVLIALTLFPRALALAEEKPLGRFQATVELPKGGPYVGEPLRLRLRSAIHARVATDRIIQPALTDFDWQQFGVDESDEEFVDGFWMPAHTRTLMIYPLRAGRLTIEPFKWRLSYFTEDGARTEMEMVSQPLTVDVRGRESLGEAMDFWLPAKALRVVDRWEPEPDRIPSGEMSKRTVTVEAEGLTADRLPPLPRFRAPGVITFAGPVERQTVVTDQGPIARAVYQWTVRPVSTTPAIAPAINLRWFDITKRTLRETAAPERRVAFLGALSASRAEEATRVSGLLSPSPLLAAFLAFVSAGAATWLAASSKSNLDRSWRRRATTWGLLLILHVRARGQDIEGFRQTLRKLSKTEPECWRRVTAREDVASALAALDAAIFAREPQAPPVPLGVLAKRITFAFRGAGQDGRE